MRIHWQIMLVIATMLNSMVCAVEAQDSAVAIMYSKISRVDSASTDLTAFENHLNYLSSGNYQVMPLPQIVAALRNSTSVPENAIAITFDGGNVSIYHEAWPRLKKLGFPFTVFIATAFIDAGGDSYMSWDQLREMASSGVTIGTLGTNYSHLASVAPSAASKDIAGANQRIVDEIGIAPELFAYPFGEYSNTLQQIVGEYGHSAAFGQHSGVIYKGSDYLALPRYPVTGAYSDMDRFRTIIDTLPLPITDLVPSQPLLLINPPRLGFTVADNVGPLSNLACYLGGIGKLKTEQLGPFRIEVRFSKALPQGRSRVNCTLPGPERRWRWFGLQFLVQD